MKLRSESVENGDFSGPTGEFKDSIFRAESYRSREKNVSTGVTKFRVALYGVLVENGRVLMTNTRVPSGIITNFPGGGLELGEAPHEAVVREFMEETTISVTLDRLLFCTQDFRQNPEYPHEQLMHIYYQVTRLGGEVSQQGNGDDVESTAWVSPDELTHHPIQPVDLEFVQHPSFRALFLKR